MVLVAPTTPRALKCSRRYTVALAADNLRRIVADYGGRYKIRPNVSNVAGTDEMNRYSTCILSARQNHLTLSLRRSTGRW